jgi:hypothetical protein
MFRAEVATTGQKARGTIINAAPLPPATKSGIRVIFNEWGFDFRLFGVALSNAGTRVSSGTS